MADLRAFDGLRPLWFEAASSHGDAGSQNEPREEPAEALLEL
ncbi:hypothetical protein [Aquisalimonas sp.]|nr:hypothetical protein [Aquisalimonas sp.]